MIRTVFRAVRPPCSLPTNGTGCGKRTWGPIMSQVTRSRNKFSERGPYTSWEMPPIPVPCPTLTPTPPSSHFPLQMPSAHSSLPSQGSLWTGPPCHHQCPLPHKLPTTEPSIHSGRLTGLKVGGPSMVCEGRKKRYCSIIFDKYLWHIYYMQVCLSVLGYSTEDLASVMPPVLTTPPPDSHSLPTYRQVTRWRVAGPSGTLYG